MITNINDVVVTLKDGPHTTNSYVYLGLISKFYFYVTLRESKSLVALYLLRSSTDERINNGTYTYYDNSITLFSRTMSKKLNAPLIAGVNYWQMLRNTQPPTSSPSSSPSSKPSSKPSPPSSSKTPSKSKVISLISAHLHSS